MTANRRANALWDKDDPSQNRNPSGKDVPPKYDKDPVGNTEFSVSIVVTIAHCC
jgi:hypothetical protein